MSELSNKLKNLKTLTNEQVMQILKAVKISDDKKDARIKELEAEVEYQKNSATNFCKQSQAKNEIIDQLKEREKKLVECVRFYAEGEIKADLEIRPEKRELWSIPDRWAQRSMSDHYAGKCARQTLKELGINNE